MKRTVRNTSTLPALTPMSVDRPAPKQPAASPSVQPDLKVETFLFQTWQCERETNARLRKRIKDLERRLALWKANGAAKKLANKLRPHEDNR